MILFVSIIHVIVCLALVGIILLQPGRGMGLSGAAFGGSDSQSVFGVKTADVLTKATTVAAILFMVTCVVLSTLNAKKAGSLYANFKNQAPITMSQVQKAVEEAQKKAENTATASSDAQKAVSDLVETEIPTQSAEAPQAA